MDTNISNRKKMQNNKKKKKIERQAQKTVTKAYHTK